MQTTVFHIAQRLKTDGLTLKAYDTVESTNVLCKAAAAEGAPEGTVILADSQTGGKGTRGRSFFSPSGTGLYMSVLLRPQGTAEQALRITTAAAVAVCEAIEAVSARRPQIKWVNDIYCDEKKVCGILAEAVLDPKTARPEAVVLGIGINVLMPQEGFPAELNDTAAAVFETGGDRAALAAAALDAFFARYAALDDPQITQEYRRRSLLDGRTVTVTTPDGDREATVRGIDEQCRLCVRYTDGEEAVLSSGDVTLHTYRP